MFRKRHRPAVDSSYSDILEQDKPEYHSLESLAGPTGKLIVSARGIGQESSQTLHQIVTSF